MLLELDAGNTRLKWRVSELNPQDAATRVGALLARGVVVDAMAVGGNAAGDPVLRAQACLKDLLVQLEKSGIAELKHILVSSVRGDQFREQALQLLERSFGVVPEFAVSAALAAGVSSAYAQPEKLGVDRWLEMLAAYADAKAACCVLDCGTTITLDVIDAEGRHMGGYIVPGLQLMLESLAKRSPALAIEAARFGLYPGANTQAAISHGVLNMALGFLNFEHRKMSRLLAERGGENPAVKIAENEPRWYFTGGDAETLAAYIEWEFKLVPDLVLDGLRLSLVNTLL